MKRLIEHVKQAWQFFKSKDNYRIFKQNYLQNQALIKQQKVHSAQTGRLLAVYDFLDLPYTSDINAFILNADVERRQRQLQKLDLVLVTNDKYPANPAYEKRINQHNYRHLIYNMAIEYSRLYEHIGSVMLLDDRQQAIDIVSTLKRNSVLFPADYDPHLPGERMTYFDRPLTYHFPNYVEFARKDASFSSLKATDAVVKLARKWLRSHVYPMVPITITLREDSHVQPERANNIEQWQEFIDSYLDDERFVFVVLRDYYNLYEDNVLTGDNVLYCNEAVISMGFRAALHQEVSLNLFIPTGVNVVSTLSTQTRYLQFKMVIEEVNVTSEKMLEKLLGIAIGENWPGATKYQKNVWLDDDFKVLRQETDNMLQLMEQDGVLYPSFYDAELVSESNNTSLRDNDQLSQSADVLLQIDGFSPEASSISQRPSLGYYLWSYKVYNALKMTNFLLKKYISGFPYKAIDRLRLVEQHRILFYGAGSVTKYHISKYGENVIGVIDKGVTDSEGLFAGFPTFPVAAIATLQFDYMVVTPQNHEIQIIEQLAKQFQIKSSKLLVISSDVYRP